MSVNGHNGALPPRRLATLTAGLLLIDDARIHGLIDGGPAVDRRRCNAVLRNLRRDGIVPEHDEVSAAALSLMAELGLLAILVAAEDIGWKLVPPGDITGLGSRTVVTEEDDGTHRCEECGQRVNQTCGSYWLATDELWNELVGRTDIVLCIPCFTERARVAGRPVWWTPMFESESKAEILSVYRLPEDVGRVAADGRYSDEFLGSYVRSALNGGGDE